ncbi:MAG: FAD-dependent oxidoreductase [Dehalococcoidia bacterium]|jgi:2,4-dienoyl-CoA reductase (NADPH2)
MADNKRFHKLMEPCNIGSVKTRNRIIKTGAGMLMWHEDELEINQKVMAFYEGLARGGVGLLIVESPTIDYPLGARWRQRFRIDDDKYIKGLSALPEIIHKYGCPTFMQMNHDGPWQRIMFEPTPLSPGPPIAASPVSFKSDNDFHNEIPRELTIEEIEEIIDKFASAAVRAEKAGFDGVDVNAASSHLLHNFISPFWNRRRDKYGGSRENRVRIATSIIKEIKKRLGQDFPVSVCINGIEIGQVVGVNDSHCLTPEESRETARLLQQAGADAIQIRSQWLGYHVGAYLPDLLMFPEPPIPYRNFPPDYNWKNHGAGANINYAAATRRVVSVPVITVGRLDPVLGEKYLREGKADFIGMTRRLIADPELPNKVAAGRLEDIAPCTACENCLGSGRCRINANLAAGINKLEPATRSKKVMVVGGGPSGMEAARVAAVRGHDVSLYEKSGNLGGLMPVAALVKGTRPEDIPSLISYLITQITKLGVKIHTDTGVTPALVEEVKPDVVVLATGGVAAVPDISGIDGKNVVQTSKLHNMLKFFLKFLGIKTLRWLTMLWMPLGKRIVIIGGGIQGCQLGEFLTERGKKVTIVDTADELGKGMVDAVMAYLFTWFKKKGVIMMPGVKDIKINEKGLTLTEKGGERDVIVADNIIPAVELSPDTPLMESIREKGFEVHAIGDCREPNLIADAITDGARIGREI